MKKRGRGHSRLTQRMLVSRYSEGKILAPTADNFPALKNFWDMKHISDTVLQDLVGTQDITSPEGWGLDSMGFFKYSFSSDRYPPGDYEAPGDRDFMLIGCGLITYTTRAITIGGNYIETDPDAPGMAFEVNNVTITPPAFLDVNNRSGTAPFSFNEDPRLDTFAAPTSPEDGITGCFATVISPTAGTVKSYWAGRTAEDPSYEEIIHPIAIGSIQATWPALGTGWTMYPYNRFEWVGLMMFESGAPLDMQEAMKWMAQYDNIRLYPGWLGKK